MTIGFRKTFLFILLLIIIVLLAIWGVSHYATKSSAIPPITSSELEELHEKIPPQGQVTGTITEIGEGEFTLSFSTIERAVIIDPETRIFRSYQHESSPAPVEINLSDLVIGEEVQVFYQKVNQDHLSMVPMVLADGAGQTLSDYHVATANSFVRVQVVSLDGDTIIYHPVGATGAFLTDITQTATFTDQVAVYQVNSLARSLVTHARTPAELTNVAPGDIVSIIYTLETQSLDAIVITLE